MLDPICTINVFGWLATLDENILSSDQYFVGKMQLFAFFVARPQENFPKVKDGSLKNYLDMNV